MSLLLGFNFIVDGKRVEELGRSIDNPRTDVAKQAEIFKRYLKNVFCMSRNLTGLKFRKA